MADKFSDNEVYAKTKLRQIREGLGWNRSRAAQETGLTVKNLEDIEATRDYGCHLSWDTLLLLTHVYDIKLEELINPHLSF